MSTKWKITRCIPEGGAPSPFLWLLHFDSPHLAAEQCRAGWRAALSELVVLVLLFADDIAFALARGNAYALIRAATIMAGVCYGRLRALGLILGEPKSKNMVVSPGNLIGGGFRRGGAALRAALLEEEKQDDRIEALNKMTAEAGETPGGGLPSGTAGFPFA